MGEISTYCQVHGIDYISAFASLSPSAGERFHGPRKAAICSPEPLFCKSLEINTDSRRFMGREKRAAAPQVVPNCVAYPKDSSVYLR